MTAGQSAKDAIVLDSETETETESEGEIPVPTRTLKTGPAEAGPSKTRTSPAVDIKGKGKATPPATAPVTSHASNPSTLNDRAALEAARLERNRKRRREQGLPSDDDEPRGPPVVRKLNGEEAPLAAHQAATTPSANSSGSKFGTLASLSNSHATKRASASNFQDQSTVSDPIYQRIRPSDRFWKGAIKHTWSTYAPAPKQGVPFSDLILPATPEAKNGLKQAVLCTFTLHADWLFPQLPTAASLPAGVEPPELTFISADRVDGQMTHAAIWVSDDPHTRGFRYVIPSHPKNGSDVFRKRGGCHHMKFVLLEFESHLRFVLLSANFENCDWDFVENVVWLQDFPLKTAPHPLGPPSAPALPNDTHAQLDEVLNRLGLPRGHPMRLAMNNFDMTRASGHLVATFPQTGAIEGWDQVRRSGIGRLAEVVESFKMRKCPSGGHVLEMQGSSIGNYTEHWIRTMHAIASGACSPPALPLGSTPAVKHVQAVGRQRIPDKGKWPSRVKFIFPSAQFIDSDEIVAKTGRGTFHSKSTHFKKNHESHLMYCEPISRRAPTLMHAKSLIALPPEVTDPLSVSARDSVGEGDVNEVIGWMCIGSHNATEAAWGDIRAHAQTKEIQSDPLNFELGIIFPIRRGDLGKPVNERCFALQAHSYKHPLRPYAPDHHPWDQKAPFASLFGQGDLAGLLSSLDSE